MHTFENVDNSGRPLTIGRLDRCDRVTQNESSDPNGGNVCLFSAATMQITFLSANPL